MSSNNYGIRYINNERYQHDLVPGSGTTPLVSGCLQKEWIDQYTPDPKVIFIVGSCDGGDEIKLHSWFPQATIYSFEAIKENYDLAVSNIAHLNTDKIHVYHYAVFDIDGEIEFNHSIWPKGDHEGSFYLQDITHRQINNIQSVKIKVPCITLKTFCEQNNIDNIDVIQIDVEGAGYEVIQGMQEIKPTMICIEVQAPRSFQDGNHQPAEEDELITLIVKKGYIYVAQLPHDYLFVKN